MIDARKKEDEMIVIQFSGDREDYVNTLKALVHLLSNQKEPNGMHNMMCSNLINDMLTTLT